MVEACPRVATWGTNFFKLTKLSAQPIRVVGELSLRFASGDIISLPPKQET